MNSFEIIRENLAAAGIDLHSSKQISPFTFKNVVVLSIIGNGVISSTLYIYCEADSFEQYVNSTCEASTLLACGLVFTNLIWVTMKVDMLLNDFERTISRSKQTRYFVF